MRLIFDGHVDLALFALARNRDITQGVAQINERERGMDDIHDRTCAVMSLPEMRRGGVAVCQSTLAARADGETRPTAFAASVLHNSALPDTPMERAATDLSMTERVGMVLDLTHTDDESFFQALDDFSGPVLASHNNRTLVPHERQFSDEQLNRLLERDAVIGATMDAWMLVPGWDLADSKPGDLRLASVVDHIDHVCQLAGDSLHAAIGSDTGGSNHMPVDFETSADLQRLEATMQDRGYSQEDIDNVFNQ